MLVTISNFIIPILVLLIIIYGIVKRVDIYDVFIEGSKESFDMIFSLFPSLLAMILGINIFLKSGLLDTLMDVIKPILVLAKIPIEIIPMALIRPISGSSSLAFLNNLLIEFGPDSFIGRLGSIIQGSTDTTFYIITLYFGSIGIKKIRYALWAGLFADLIGIISSIIIAHIFLIAFTNVFRYNNKNEVKKWNEFKK